MIGDRHEVCAFIGSSSGSPSQFPVVIRGPQGRYSWEGQSSEWWLLCDEAHTAARGVIRAEARLEACGDGWRWVPIAVLPEPPARLRRR